MKVNNYGFGMPNRMEELWPWIVALDSWEYCDAEPLSELIKSSDTLPSEIASAIANIVTGERKQNKRGAAKLKIDPAERMKIAGSISCVLGLIDGLKFDVLDNDMKPTGATGIADRHGKEPIEVKRELEEEAEKIINDAAANFGVSTETIENLLRDLRNKIKNWPSV